MTKKHRNWGWVFVTPYIVGLLLFFLIPVIFSIYVSFTKYNLFNPPEFVGLRNYIELFSDKEIWYACRNTLVLAVVYMPLQMIIACVIAVLLNQKIRAMSVFRSIYFLPVLTPMVAVCVVWSFMYNPDFGILNYLFSFFNLGPFSYIYSTSWFEFIVSIGVMSIWKGVGQTAVYLLAGLTGIDTEILESAEIDGAGSVRRFFKITLPLLSPTIFFLLIIGMIGVFQTFDSIYTMQVSSGANTEVLGTLIYKYAFDKSKLGLASAVGWVTFLLVGVFTFIQKKYEKRWVHYE